jgi:hypothetical protein
MFTRQRARNEHHDALISTNALRIYAQGINPKVHHIILSEQM